MRFAFPFKTQPAHILLDGINVFHVFLHRIGIVKAQIALAAEIPGKAEVDADGLGVADVQVPVGFGRKARVHSAAEAAAFVVLRNARAQERPQGQDFLRGGAGRFGLLTHELAPDPAALPPGEFAGKISRMPQSSLRNIQLYASPFLRSMRLRDALFCSGGQGRSQTRTAAASRPLRVRLSQEARFGP